MSERASEGETAENGKTSADAFAAAVADLSLKARPQPESATGTKADTKSTKAEVQPPKETAASPSSAQVPLPSETTEANIQPQREDAEHTSSAQTPVPTSATKAEPSQFVTDAVAASPARPETEYLASAVETEPRKATAAEVKQESAAERREMAGDTASPETDARAQTVVPESKAAPLAPEKPPITEKQEMGVQLPKENGQRRNVDESADIGEADEPGPRTRLDEPEQEIRTIVAGDTLYASATRFEALPIGEELLQGLYVDMKFEKPSKIQAVSLPMILTPPHRSLIAQAHNGSGKTTCFVLAMLSRIDPTLHQPQAMCVVPTRELVVQNLAVLQRMGRHTQVTTMSTAVSELELPRGHRISQHVIIGTHGRLKTWMSKRTLGLDNIKILVLDEADEMLKHDGFASDSVRMVTAIRNRSPNVQVLLFSATFNDGIRRFAVKYAGDDANQLFVPKEQLSLDVIKQFKVVCPTGQSKLSVLTDMIFPAVQRLGQTIIFVRTRETARALHAHMEREGFKVTSIQGDMEREVRDRVVSEFRRGVTRILIATDVLSRGFDVQEITLVINFTVPTERDGYTPAYETYLHRIGRSGRFGRRGAAFNLVTGATESRTIDAISDYFRHPIEEVPYNDDARFEEVLVAAGLSKGTD